MCCDSHSRRYYRDEPEPIGGHRPQPLAFRVVMRPSLRAANYFALGTLFALHVAYGKKNGSQGAETESRVVSAVSVLLFGHKILTLELLLFFFI
jgi:hypothetical protein